MKYVIELYQDEELEYHYLVEYENHPSVYRYESDSALGQAMTFDSKVQAGAAAKILKQHTNKVGKVLEVTEREIFEARLKGG